VAACFFVNSATARCAFDEEGERGGRGLSSTNSESLPQGEGATRRGGSWVLRTSDPVATTHASQGRGQIAMSFPALPPACEGKACKAVQGRRHRAKNSIPTIHTNHIRCAKLNRWRGGGGRTTHTHNTCMYVYCRPYLPQTVAEGTEVRGEGSAVVGKGTHDWSHSTSGHDQHNTHTRTHSRHADAAWGAGPRLTHTPSRDACMSVC
jgi:hypothetical protein